MGFADRVMHTFESVMAFPFGFFFGYDNSPEPQWRDPEQPTVQPMPADAAPVPAPTAEPARADRTSTDAAPEPAAPTVEPAGARQATETTVTSPEPTPVGRQSADAADWLATQRLNQTRQHERTNWERAHWDAQEHYSAKTRAASLLGEPAKVNFEEVLQDRLKEIEAARRERDMARDAWER